VNPTNLSTNSNFSISSHLVSTGVYVFNYTAYQPGKFQINVTIGATGQLVRGSPFNITVTGTNKNKKKKE
jgi:hypothetical protein